MVEPEKLIILDRDGVINEDSDDFIKSPEEWQPIAGSLEAIANLHRAGYRIVVVTNQSGVGRGLFTASTLSEIHQKMRSLIMEHGGDLAGVYVCPHRPTDGCDCRKPRPGLLQRIENDFGRPLKGVPFVGDKPSDLGAARAVGARAILVRTGYGETTLNELANSSAEVEVHKDLAAAARALLGEEKG